MVIVAIIFNIKCKSKDERDILRNKMCKGLAGSSAFKNSEIAVCDLQDDAFTLIVGANNACDIEYDLHSAQLLER